MSHSRLIRINNQKLILVKINFSPTKIFLKKNWSPNIGKKKLWSENVGSKNLDPIKISSKKFLLQKSFLLRNIFIQKYFGYKNLVKKNLFS